MVTMLERLSVHQARKLAYGHRITVTFSDGRLEEFQLLRYFGFSFRLARHAFVVRDAAGNMFTASDYQLGLSGDHAVARLGEPERLAADDALPAALTA